MFVPQILGVLLLLCMRTSVPEQFSPASLSLLISCLSTLRTLPEWKELEIYCIKTTKWERFCALSRKQIAVFFVCRLAGGATASSDCQVIPPSWFIQVLDLKVGVSYV